MGESTIHVNCQNSECGKEFIKRLSEFNRSQKLGRPHFCSLSCHAKYRGLGTSQVPVIRQTSHLKDIIQVDDFSPFRYHLKIMKKSAKRRGHECSVTLADLKALWERQNGICPYTGWNLINLGSTTECESSLRTIYRASVDRLDSSKGYTRDNIQFIAVIANFAKNVFTEQDLINFCHDVYQHRILGKSNPLRALNIINTSFHTRRDEFSPYRRHLRLARTRVKINGRLLNITLEYLKDLWEKQEGKCPYTGWELENFETTSQWNNHQLHPKTASLDRIDSKLGYIEGNVQFVSVMANYAKLDFQEAELLEFCKAVFDYRELLDRNRFPNSSVRDALKAASCVRLVLSDQAMQAKPALEAETMLITDVAMQGWAVATATEAYLLLEDGQIDEAQQLLALEVPKFKNTALQWSDSLIADERKQLRTAYRFTAPHFKQHISNERAERIVYISSTDNSLSQEQIRRKKKDVELEFEMSYSSIFDQKWTYRQIAIAEYLDAKSELLARLESIQAFADTCESRGAKSSLDILPDESVEPGLYSSILHSQI
ncbi:hypothetical protein NIES4071_54810 [Calothrix sp. NIES-4071]|nr:hypothetical protein NIES4071_54810 [Calothrix sp. NIES-4071]BAZ59789.1 hypothetical protein NIES4105_54760 [Calothrix sp. NIES-4105]